MLTPKVDPITQSTREVAEALHDKFCTSEHMERCGWYYEVSWKNPWEAGYAHKRWYEAAKNFLHKYYSLGNASTPALPTEKLIEIVNALGEALRGN